MSKYNARKTVVDGIKFDSKAESKRYLELKEKQSNGEISELQTQVSFEVLPKQPGERSVKYIADFVYRENGETIVEDYKSKATKTSTYIIKRKLFKHRYPDKTFREIVR